jgi:hypothetical protein
VILALELTHDSLFLTLWDIFLNMALLQYIGSDILAPKKLFYDHLDDEGDYYDDGQELTGFNPKPISGEQPEATPETFLKSVCITYFFIS